MADPGHNGPHDVGGVECNDLLDLREYDYKFWERQVHSLMLTLVRKGLFTVDELRRGVEALSPEATEAMTYYEKWASAMTAICLERGTLTRQEIDAALGPVDDDTSVKFKAGDVVRVKVEDSAVRWRRPHLRTPGYIFGLVGTIERECQGLFGFPEAIAFREVAAKQPLYRVRFSQSDVWEGYVGPESDTIDIEIYQPWLEPATQQDLEAQRAARRARVASLRAAGGLVHKEEAGAHGHHGHHHHDHDHHDHHEHEHEHGHAHDHGDGSAPHVHEARCVVEQNAVDKEGEDSERRRLAEALVRALVDKGVVNLQELREGVEVMDARGRQAGGARLVARAWVDPAFKQRLLQDAGAAAAELGVSASVYPSAPGGSTPASTAGPNTPGAALPPGPQPRTGTILTVVENTPEVHNVVVCTLCSCYPLSVLGMSPPWYKSRAYRARVVRDPRGVLREFGTVLPDNVAVRVHDSTADNRYLVLPQRPEGTEGWSEEALQALATRDSMIGVTRARDPKDATPAA
uniref:nitrile hydratase n=1 Tax=Chlamydomonas leiostraca TaxID=1034604 RepID=A0A7S0RZI6_9CHLO|mmetsp:Transcript_3622/g.9044  ORF Transcript_3622/g.9044 Transcript_3622/m.9044 type:complete len:518 (+) Transcript_3622:53-1606(+)|eukprot:CAMPEP_0202857848 /NCGR_PEP_ID=MMETSP1391-20130828/624_1 /ASSEMBLY_ACC=CAM_ASM_000867 /TAXON_ID=1034604 /ORGANISM="Chlamydomonas leiostraca, Strain SAG 11-49" /LENGTH=517 /DNA_ID=CAMNT_0049536705 /DNA_START=52 /DNA_END=1605 /DNA_ORIENTATION=+